MGVASKSHAAEGLRALVIGAGLMGRWHAQAAASAGAQIAGVCDVDEAAARRLAARWGAVSNTDPIQLLERLAPSVVHVCTPPATHRRLAEEALVRGVHAIVEKPLTSAPEETERLLELARERGRVLCPVHQLAFQRWIPLVRRTGEILDLSYTTCSAAGAGRSAADLDGVAAEILPHPLSLFERIQAGSLEAARWTALQPASGELRALALAKGTSLCISISLSGRPSRHELRITGTRGSLTADLFHGFAWFEGAHVSRRYKIARPFAVAARELAGATGNLVYRAWHRQPAYPGLAELVRAVYGEICGTSSTALSPEHTRRVAHARHALLAGL